MKKIMILILSAMLLFSCAGLRKHAVKISEEYVQNQESAVKIAKNLHAIWPLTSGFIKGVLFHDYDKLENEVTSAIDELDKYSKRPAKELNNEDFGYILGLRTRLVSESVQEILERFDIDIMKLIF